MSDADRFLKWLDEAGKHWDEIKPEDVMRELGRTDERDERIRELEAKLKILEDTVRHVLPAMEQSSDKEICQLVPGLACLLEEKP